MSLSRRKFILNSAGLLIPVAAFAQRRLRVGKGINVGSRSLITQSDISFVGWMRLPVIYAQSGYDNDFMFTYGAMTARTVGGNLRFLMAASRTQSGSSDKCVEFSDPGSYSATLNGSTPIGSVVRYWGDIYQGKQAILDETVPYCFGYHWDGTYLWWLWARRYNAGSNYYDPTIGCSILNGDGSSTPYGTWRAGPNGSFRYCDYMLGVPSYWQSNVSGKPFLIGGSGDHSGYQTTPYGPDLAAFASFNPTTTPADTYSGQRGTASVSTTQLIGYDIDHRLTVSERTGYRGSEGPYGGVYPQVDVSYMTVTKEFAPQLDQMRACVWVDTGTKHGVLWFGQLVDTLSGHSAPGDPDGLAHYGYGDPDGPSYGQGRPNQTCYHGQDDPSWGATGPFAYSLVPWCLIVDPARFLTVLGGGNPWDAGYDSAFRLNSILNLSSHASGRTGRYTFGGSYWDSSRNYLFVVVNDIDGISTYYSRPAIAVFGIG